ncbi:unnamed protein product, partial [Choristocarpus tenellus]
MPNSRSRTSCTGAHNSRSGNIQNTRREVQGHKSTEDMESSTHIDSDSSSVNSTSSSKITLAEHRRGSPPSPLTDRQAHARPVSSTLEHHVSSGDCDTRRVLFQEEPVPPPSSTTCEVAILQAKFGDAVPAFIAHHVNECTRPNIVPPEWLQDLLRIQVRGTGTDHVRSVEQSSDVIHPQPLSEGSCFRFSASEIPSG